MSDTPADPSGREEPGEETLSGPRRSTFSPAPADAPLPGFFDDDALAAAMEAEVRPYTSPIDLPVPGNPEPVREAAEPQARADAVVAPEPAFAPEPEFAPEPAFAPEAVFAPEPAATGSDPVAPVDDEQLLRDLQGISTLDAMQRLEEELARRAVATAAEPVAPTAPEPAAPEPPAPEQIAPEPAMPEPIAPAPAPAPALAPVPPRLPDAWDSAPPPGFVPPPLVEPPSPEPEPEPLARLLPPPTDLPDIAFRAELPPPPGYAEDGTAAPELLAAPEVLAAPAADAGWDQLFASPAVDAPSLLEPDAENDDVVDVGDRIAPTDAAAAAASGIAMPPAPVPVPGPGPAPVPAAAPPLGAGAPPAHDEPAIPAPPASSPRAFQVEQTGVEPTPLERRAGRASRLFWLWFAANASIVSVSLGAVMFGMGMSLRQAIVATVVGIALSFIPLGFGTLAGKWSGQPTMIVSRAGFGVVGNIVPAFLALAVRVFWGGVLVWLLADAVAQTVVRARIDPGLGATGWALVGLAAGVVLAAAVAVVGYGLLARVQLLLSILAGIVIVAAAAVSVPKMHLDVALTHQDGPWTVVAGGAVLVFSFVGLVWAQSGSDIARYQRPGGSGAASMLWATFGATIPPFLLIAWGALLAASNPVLAAGLAAQPLATIAGLLPSWYPAPLLAAAAVGLLSGSVLTMYSGGFVLQSLLPRMRRTPAVVVAAMLVLAVGVALVLLGLGNGRIVRDIAVTLAVPVAAWAGIFGAEMMVRQRRFHAPSLLATGGVYPAVRWVNLIGLLLISALGYGFVVGGEHWLGWEGWALRLLGIDAGSPIAVADLGVLGALVLGVLLPLVTGVPAIRRQEAANVDRQGAGALSART